MVLFAPLLLSAVAPPRTLIVGGGPSRKYNQAAIESNVRYVARSLPKGAPLRVLFADGNAASATVRYTPKGGVEERDDRYRRPQLPRLDGPTRATTVQREIAALAKAGSSSVLLYFTGHGSVDRTSQFDLWHDEELTVPGLAAEVGAFSKTTPVVVLMVQCHAGGFADLLFPGGDPAKRPLEGRLCGFYASIEARPAAGCTPSIDEADYKDFTGYFVAALTGKDRLGRPVGGADYDHDGRVGMDEAFCWAMVHDDSIDTPVCTSDEFLRAVVRTPDVDVFSTPYPQVLEWARPAPRAAMEALCASLRLTGDDRLVKAYEAYSQIGEDDDDPKLVRGFRLLRLAKSVVLGHQMAKHPDAALRKRYETLLKDEAANPFRP